MGKLACVAVVKNEERHIAEWLAFQFATGFDAVILLDNASTDATVARALDFAEHHDIRIIDWPATDPAYQTRAYEQVVRRLHPEFAWAAFFDTDEFLVLDPGLRLRPVLEAVGAAAAIAVPWAIFGSSGHRQMPAGLVIETFCRRSSLEMRDNQHVKSIVRPERVTGCLNPHVFAVDGDYADLSGRNLTWMLPGVLAHPPDYLLGKLHHYFTRSHADWLEKLRRGYHDTERHVDEFNRFDRNDLFDDSAARFAPAVKHLLAGLAHPQPDDPKPEPAPAPPPAVSAHQPDHEFVLVACARWETAYIVEWLTYHRWLGFDHVFLYCNDDDPAALYAAVLPFIVGAAPFVTFHHEPVQGRQAEMYRHFLRTHKAAARWFMFLDIDEFLVLRRARNLAAFMARFAASADQVFFNWLPYGTSGHDEPAPGSVLLNYTRREPFFHPLTKYIVRAEAVPEAVRHHSFWHDLGREISATLRMTNPIGLDMAGYDFATGKQDLAAYSANPASGETLVETAYIAHFAFKSRADFLRRAQRGLGGDFAHQTIWTDMYNSPDFEGFLRHINSAEDLTLRTQWQDVLNQGQRAKLALPPPAGPAPAPPLATPAPPPKLDFSYSVNPLGAQGFVIGWEAALLGNRLSSFANLFALHYHTGVPVMYPQIMTAGALFDVQSTPDFFLQGELAAPAAPLAPLVEAVDRVFAEGYDAYQRGRFTLPLEALPLLPPQSGIVIYGAYLARFQDLEALQDGIKAFCQQGNGIILPGAFWGQYRDMRTLAACGVLLRQKLKLHRRDAAGSRAAAMAAAGEAVLRIGVHIRQGDYQHWHGGQYCFSTAQYAALMWHLHLSLGDRPHHFCVCSDQPIEARLLQGLPVWYERGAQEDDFVALANCHYVIGPPSTFGTWSAFLGGRKRVILTPERMADLQSWSPLLEAAVDVPYPTGGYLPGDPAAAPF